MVTYIIIINYPMISFEFLIVTAEKNDVFHQGFPQETANLGTFTQDIPNRKLLFC